MDIKKHYIYTIKDKFFEDFPDPHLLNKGENRPNYYVFEGDQKDVLWFIPMSSQTDKYERLIQQKTEQGKRTDFAHVCQVDNRKQAFLIQNMFPVTKDYIKEEYIVSKNHYHVRNPEDINAIQNKANRIQQLIKRGIKIMPTLADVKDIESKLIQKIESREQELLVTEEKGNQETKNQDLTEDLMSAEKESAAVKEFKEQQSKQERRKAFLRNQRRER